MADLESDGLSSGTGVHTILHRHDYSEKGTAGNDSNNGITSGVVDESLGKGGNDAWAPRNEHHRGTNDGTGFVGLFKKTIWHGGSVYDAWLNATAAQVGQVILTMPTSYAQMGYRWAVIFHIFYIATGIYTCYLLTRLYIEYRVRKEKEGVDFKKHIIQYHEVLGSLVGMWAQRVSLFFNIITVGAISVVQIIACASDAYYLNPHLPKRTWTAVFGAMSMVVVMLPTMHNFRIWSLIGILTTTYTAWYLFGASISNGQVGTPKLTKQNSHDRHMNIVRI
jgi:auxin influx carrier (AUX1 LAX family)